MQSKIFWTSVIAGIIVVAAAGTSYFSIFIGKNTGSEKSAPIEKGEYDTFAQCLTERGMVMYGSITCKFCAKQRELFGHSFRFIKEIECDPRNPNPETERCVAKNITATPTWIREDVGGVELYRFPAGIQTLEQLSKVATCPLIKDSLTP